MRSAHLNVADCPGVCRIHTRLPLGLLIDLAGNVPSIDIRELVASVLVERDSRRTTVEVMLITSSAVAPPSAKPRRRRTLHRGADAPPSVAVGFVSLVIADNSFVSVAGNRCAVSPTHHYARLGFRRGSASQTFFTSRDKAIHLQTHAALTLWLYPSSCLNYSDFDVPIDRCSRLEALDWNMEVSRRKHLVLRLVSCRPNSAVARFRGLT